MNTNLQVLVIDDDAVVGRSFDRVLSGKGYDVRTALSGEEGLDTLENTEFDVVFTDIKMPGIDGLEVAERIKAKCPWTPVVVITGYGTEDNEARASVLGVSGFVRKPLTPEIIESITLKAVNEAKVVPEAAQPGKQAEAVAETEIETVVDSGGPNKAGIIAKNVGLFFASPFIALGYVIALPFVGFYMFAKLGFSFVHKPLTPEVIKSVTLKAVHEAQVILEAAQPDTEVEVLVETETVGETETVVESGGPKKAGDIAKNVGLFLASPFIALGYVIALPFVGFYMFAKLSREAYAKKQRSK
jgi:CheY-like chemotaxis protein